MKKKLSILLIILLLTLTLLSCTYLDGFIEQEDDIVVEDVAEIEDESKDIDRDGYFTSKEDVALYIHTYGELPNNYITKKDAREQGWDSSKANLWDVTDKKSIGGDRFGNREGNLPSKQGRQYYEADIDYEGEYRGAKRIVYSDDGLIYYTDDHYDTFTLLYGDE